MQSISVFLDIAKYSDFWRNNADVGRIQVLCHVIHIFFWIFFIKGISVRSFITAEYVWQVLGRTRFFPPPYL